MRDRVHFRLSYAAATLCVVLFAAAFASLAYIQRSSELGISVPSINEGYDRSSGVRTYVFNFEETPSEQLAVQFFSKEAPTEIQFNSSALAVSKTQESSSFLLPAVKSNTSAEIPRNYFLPGVNQLGLLFDESRGEAGLGKIAILSSSQANTVFALQEKLSWLMPALAIIAGLIAVLISVAGLTLGKRTNEYVPLLTLGLIMLVAGVLSKGYSIPFINTHSYLPSALIALAQASLLLFLAYRKRLALVGRDPIDTAALAIAVFSIFVSVWTLAFGTELFGALSSYCVSLVGSLPFILYRLIHLIVQDIIAFRQTLLALENTITKQAMQLDEKSEVIAKEMIRNAILEERQRMMRDIHDGIGSQLLSLMLRVKSGKIGKSETTSGIKQSLTDLRLVVDSADHLGGDLAAAFATFRSRALQQFNAANIKMNWQLSEGLLGQSKSTGKTLDIYRFMQEAVANIVSHSGARTATLKVTLEPEQGSLLLEISDDGIGLPPKEKRKAGKGLRNLEKRAKLLDAGYSIGCGVNGIGTMVTLKLNHAQFSVPDHSLIQPS